MIHGKKVVVVLPPYNAARTLRQTVADLPADVADGVLLVDDASHDSTAALARALGLHTFVHPTNVGYGGNQKTCYTQALRLGADVVVMVRLELGIQRVREEDERRADGVAAQARAIGVDGERPRARRPEQRGREQPAVTVQAVDQAGRLVQHPRRGRGRSPRPS